MEELFNTLAVNEPSIWVALRLRRKKYYSSKKKVEYIFYWSLPNLYIIDSCVNGLTIALNFDIEFCLM